MSDPVLSVIIACYNGSSFLDACVQSIAAQGVSAEIIIVDDGSTDDSLEHARELMRLGQQRIILASQANQGQAAARNLGTRMAAGKYLGFLDVDDEYVPQSLSLLLDALSRDGAALAAQGRIEIANAHRPVEEWQRRSMEATVPGAIVVRTEVARRLGGFSVDPAFRGKVGGEDGAFRLQLEQLGRVLKLDRPLLRYRLGPGSHADYFLERSRLVDGRLEFAEQSPEEKDGSLFAAFNRYADDVANRLVGKATELLQCELTAAHDFDQRQFRIQHLDGNVEPLEGFALFAFARRWPSNDPVVCIGRPDPRGTVWLGEACRAAGKPGPVSVEDLKASWGQPIRMLFVGSIESAEPALFGWAHRLARHGLLILFCNLENPAMSNLYDQLRRDSASWRPILKIGRLAILEKLS
jgi:glycosyltransferase involved in cell wall biosynthesis